MLVFSLFFLSGFQRKMYFNIMYLLSLLWFPVRFTHLMWKCDVLWVYFSTDLYRQLFRELERWSLLLFLSNEINIWCFQITRKVGKKHLPSQQVFTRCKRQVDYIFWYAFDTWGSVWKSYFLFTSCWMQAQMCGLLWPMKYEQSEISYFWAEVLRISL